MSMTSPDRIELDLPRKATPSFLDALAAPCGPNELPQCQPRARPISTRPELPTPYSTRSPTRPETAKGHRGASAEPSHGACSARRTAPHLTPDDVGRRSASGSGRARCLDVFEHHPLAGDGLDAPRVILCQALTLSATASRDTQATSASAARLPASVSPQLVRKTSANSRC